MRSRGAGGVDVAPPKWRSRCGSRVGQRRTSSCCGASSTDWMGTDGVLVACPPSLGVLTLKALAAASDLVLVTEPSFLALQGIDELLETCDLVRAHYNSGLALAGVIVNRVERTVEHRAGQAEIASYFGPELVWSPNL